MDGASCDVGESLPAEQFQGSGTAGRGVGDSTGRAAGGALSWGEPRAVQPFAADGPFAGLTPPADVTVRAQLMAEPGPDLAALRAAQTGRAAHVHSADREAVHRRLRETRHLGRRGDFLRAHQTQGIRQRDPDRLGRDSRVDDSRELVLYAAHCLCPFLSVLRVGFCLVLGLVGTLVHNLRVLRLEVGNDLLHRGVERRAVFFVPQPEVHVCGDVPARVAQVVALSVVNDITYLILGSSLNWWNGGGDDSVHSRVVAPGPHGLAAAFSLRAKATPMPMKKIRRPSPEM